MNGWMNEWMNEWMSEWLKRQMKHKANVDVDRDFFLVIDSKIWVRAFLKTCSSMIQRRNLSKHIDLYTLFILNRSYKYNVEELTLVKLLAIFCSSILIIVLMVTTLAVVVLLPTGMAIYVLYEKLIANLVMNRLSDGSWR